MSRGLVARSQPVRFEASGRQNQLVWVHIPLFVVDVIVAVDVDDQRCIFVNQHC